MMPAILSLYLRSPASQNGHLVSFPKAGEEQHLTSGGHTRRNEKNLAPPKVLCNGATYGRSNGSTDDRRKYHSTHGGASLLRLKHVANDGRIEDIRSDCKACQ